MTRRARRIAFFSLSALVPALLASFVVAACGSESSGAAGFGGYEAGYPGDSTMEGGSFSDSPVPDTGLAEGGGVEASTPPVSVIFVNSFSSLADIRLCWTTGGAVTSDLPFPSTGTMPGSNYPGIPLGGAASLLDARELVGGPTFFYVIDAEDLAVNDTGHTCRELICGQGPPCLRQNTGYWETNSIPGLATNASVIAVTGCFATAIDSDASVARCGSDWQAVQGNLRVDVASLAGNPPVDAGSDAPAPTQLAVQVGLLSPVLSDALGDAGVTVSFGASDGGGVVLATLDGEGQIVEGLGVTLGTSVAAYGNLGFFIDAPGLGPAGHEWMSLLQAQELVAPTESPIVFFGQPTTYLVAVLGDPNAPHAVPSGDGGPQGTYDGTGLHVLVVPAP